jgi:hypothetical protein
MKIKKKPAKIILVVTRDEVIDLRTALMAFTTERLGDQKWPEMTSRLHDLYIELEAAL